MNQGRQSICPVCGNYKQGSFCQRCNANASSRAKRWRRGDKGGVRPERRKYYKPKPDKKHSSKPAATAPRAKKRPVKKTYRPSKKLLLALQGEWYSPRNKLKINVDLATNRWVFTLSSGQRLTQIWCPEYYSSKELRFSRNGKNIVATVGNGGLLMMTGKSGPVPFVNIKSGKKYRLCKTCHHKSQWRHSKCRRCRRSF